MSIISFCQFHKAVYSAHRISFLTFANVITLIDSSAIVDHGSRNFALRWHIVEHWMISSVFYEIKLRDGEASRENAVAETQVMGGILNLMVLMAMMNGCRVTSLPCHRSISPPESIGLQMDLYLQKNYIRR